MQRFIAAIQRFGESFKRKLPRRCKGDNTRTNAVFIIAYSIVVNDLS